MVNEYYMNDFLNNRGSSVVDTISLKGFKYPSKFTLSLIQSNLSRFSFVFIIKHCTPKEFWTCFYA